MKLELTIFLPFLASFVTMVIKVILSKIENKKFKISGMPSGHAAAFGGLLTYLFLKDSSPEIISVALVITLCYLFDIWRMHYFITKDRKEIDLGHSMDEIIVGFIIGVITIVTYSKFYKF